MMKVFKKLCLFKYDCSLVNRIISPVSQLHQIKNLSNENNRKRFEKGPNLEYFIKQISPKPDPFVMKWDNEPYIEPENLFGNNSKIYIKTYGCQMNVNDTEIASTILEKFGYQITNEPEKAEIIFLMTCAIRENAENKVWTKLKELEKAKKRGDLKRFGLLGCMAERLKTKVIEEIPSIDIVAGPDSYRHLPKLLAINSLTGQNAINVLLSLDETYSDVIPKNNYQLSAYVSITRGCNNMCSYCIVPYTRGRERSRTIDSILEEVSLKVNAGIKEIILLGQNVNSYRDYSCQNLSINDDKKMLADGFKTLYKLKPGGIGFEILLDQVARIDPNVRIRFVSPHPKDFNDAVLKVIAEHKNIAKGLHLPAQSGSNEVLKRMRRGYTKEAYLNLINRIRLIIPECIFSSDFICGFCGETEEDHQQTLDLVKQVGYSIAYIFAYSMRNKTFAYHHLKDDVPHQVKIRRLTELNQIYRDLSMDMNKRFIGQRQLILIEGVSKKSTEHWYGRNEGNQKIIIPKGDEKNFSYKIGDFIEVKIKECTSLALIGEPIRTSSISDFYS